jgi:hypothetical protein
LSSATTTVLDRLAERPHEGHGIREIERDARAMSGIQQRLATGKGKFTLLYPELGTGPVSYEDSISSSAASFVPTMPGKAAGFPQPPISRVRWRSSRSQRAASRRSASVAGSGRS